MEEGNFPRISELREAASPFTLNGCARDMHCPCKNPPATLNFWFTAEKTQRGMETELCSAALPVLQQTCSGGFSEHYFWNAWKWIASVWSYENPSEGGEMTGKRFCGLWNFNSLKWWNNCCGNESTWSPWRTPHTLYSQRQNTKACLII